MLKLTKSSFSKVGPVTQDKNFDNVYLQLPFGKSWMGGWGGGQFDIICNGLNFLPK